MKEKMNFEKFKNAVTDGIREYLPDQFEIANVGLQVVTKNNNLQLTGLIIQRVGRNIAPTIYLENFYDKYQEGTDLQEILRLIADMRMEHEVNGDFDVSQITDFAKCKDKIFPRLISAGWNKELLENRPHVLIEDLAVTFFINLRDNENGSMNTQIHNKLMQIWGVTAEELYELAVKNLSDSDIGTFSPMNEVMAETMLPILIAECDGDKDAAVQMIQEILSSDDDMYILTNKNVNYGASMLLDKSMMQKVIDRIGEDFYIIPSSVHESIVIPADKNLEHEELKKMVHEVNVTQVSVEERLSDNVYRYTMSEGLKLV